MFKFIFCRCVKNKLETKAKTSCRSMGALLDLTFSSGKMYHNVVLEITVQPQQDINVQNVRCRFFNKEESSLDVYIMSICSYRQYERM